MAPDGAGSFPSRGGEAVAVARDPLEERIVPDRALDERDLVRIAGLVVNRAVKDAFGQISVMDARTRVKANKERKRNQIRATAIMWIATEDEDFGFYCELGGLGTAPQVRLAIFKQFIEAGILDVDTAVLLRKGALSHAQLTDWLMTHDRARAAAALDDGCDDDPQ